MAEINRPDITYLWGEDGNTINPPNSKVQEGWLAEIPPAEYQNWWQNRVDMALKHIYQHGLLTWSNTEEYFAGRSLVLYNDGIWVAVTDSIGNTPSTASTAWKLAVPTASTTTPGVVELATNAETIAGTSSTLAVTPAGLAAKTATTTRAGIVELATITEVRAAESSTIAVTPSSLANTIPYIYHGSVLNVTSNNYTFLSGQRSVGDYLTTGEYAGLYSGIMVGGTSGEFALSALAVYQDGVRVFSVNSDGVLSVGSVPWARLTNHISINPATNSGLVGGGDLSASRTFALGTPGGITATTTNSVIGSTHTHQIDAHSVVGLGLVAAGTDTVGSLALMRSPAGLDFAPSQLIAGSSLVYANADGESVGFGPTGTWRCQGYANGSAGGDERRRVTLWLKVA